MEPKEIDLSNADKRKYFGNVENIEKFRMSDVSIYSTSPSFQADITARLLFGYYTPSEMKTKIITDATACIGGNSYAFMKYFRMVNYVELFQLHGEIFKHNANLYGRHNYTIHINNYLDICWDLKQDVVFLDPPWGGINYEKVNDDLYLSRGAEKVAVSDLARELMDYVEIVMLKMPKNYDENRILRNAWFNNETIIMRRTDNKPLYKIIILSQPNHKRHPRGQIKKIRPLGYRFIKWDIK